MLLLLISTVAAAVAVWLLPLLLSAGELAVGGSMKQTNKQTNKQTTHKQTPHYLECCLPAEGVRARRIGVVVPAGECPERAGSACELSAGEHVRMAGGGELRLVVQESLALPVMYSRYGVRCASAWA